MRAAESAVELSASDLSHFLGCRHRTALDLAVARGQRSAPDWVDPFLRVLQERGFEHEQRFADSLRESGLGVVDLADEDEGDALAHAVDAMRAGADAILQPPFRSGRWFGRPDVLRRVEEPCAFGPWSYEVVDTKLAMETRGGTVLQLSLYSELVGEVQGAVPEFFHVVTPASEEPVRTFRVEDFAAYFRLVRGRLEVTTLDEPTSLAAASYPEPVEHCEVCRWWSACDRRRRADDHLSLVAGASRLQTRELGEAGIATLEQLATTPLPLPFVPRRGAIESFVRIREQARMQLEGRLRNAPVFELRPVEPDQGLARLPVPSPGDLFLDLEGDPFARDGGREYLFGLLRVDDAGIRQYQGWWALSDGEERAAFEALVDEICRTWALDPGMHVYHYAPYEPAALKRLMGRYASREAEIDRMLRAELFVDLHAVAKRAVVASVERYSIKDLEPFYAFARATNLAEARTNLRIVERALELRTLQAITPEARAVVQGYNCEDCLSALELRSWLEQLRGELEARGAAVPRPVPPSSGDTEELDERARRVQAFYQALVAGISSDPAQRNAEEEGHWLLAHLLDWHRREAKAPWWEFYRLRDLTADELFDERAAISGLEHAARIGGTKRSPIDQYTFPAQDTDVRRGDELHAPDGTTFGTVEEIDRVARTLKVKKRGDQADAHPQAVFAHSVVPSQVLADALLRLAEDVIAHGMSAGTRYAAARALLLSQPPRLRSGTLEATGGETALDVAVRAALNLDSTVLPIQGPPGAGKTYAGARMICELVRRGMRVGVTGPSHKVIRGLLLETKHAAQAGRLDLRAGHRVPERGDAPTSVEEFTDNTKAIDRLRSGQLQVLGGTAWLWARPEAAELVDVLFVDEAGQMSLANVLAASHAGRSVVLLGDPRQLEQPLQGSHPEGADRSALEHVLGSHKTIPRDRGIFLPETWRLAPAICAFTSEVFYENRLRPRPGLEHQGLAGTALFDGAGLWIVPASHDGNQSSSLEEADLVERVVAQVLSQGASWTNDEGAHLLTAAHVLVVAPYNAHVALLDERLQPQGVSVGTVDKFQGQEAPVVIYSMATSTPDDAPRGMEFLYSLNRLNVATSRARCACILVANPRLFEPDCKTPRQMQLANALCRYAEFARSVEL